MKMRVCIELLFLFLSVYQSFGLLKQNVLTHKQYVSRLYDTLTNGEQLPDGFEIDSKLTARPAKPKQPLSVSSITHLKELIYQGYRVEDLDVRGDTTRGAEDIHPVVKALHRRKDMQILPTSDEFRSDGFKIAIAIEGGGMRGCVAAGMVSALPYLGLEDSVDVVYGSSAGSLVGAYFIGRQLPYFGPEVYYDVLTSAGKEFIDAQAILRSCGLGLFDLRVDSLISLYKDRLGKPVLSLDYLMDTIVKKLKPLDWEIFWDKQANNTQVLKVVASGLLSRKAVVLSAQKKNFQTLEELTECMRASMLLPGVTGEVVRLKGSQAEGDNIEKTWWREWSNRQDSRMVPGSEPMSDAVIFEPIPYRSAIRENCTHIIAVRTRADNVSVTVKMSVVEKLIMTRFFGRKQGMPDLVSWMLNQYHKLVYAEDVLLLNDYNNDYDQESKGPKILCIALPSGTIPEVKRFETSRSVIFNSVRQGFAAGYDSLVLDPALRGKGWEVAKIVYPDSILDQIPAHILLQIQLEEAEEERIGRKTPKTPEEELEDKKRANERAVIRAEKANERLLEIGEKRDEETRKEVEKEEERVEREEERDFVRWIGSLKDEEIVQPKEEAVQEALSSTVGSLLSFSKRQALLSGLKRLQSIILGFGAPIFNNGHRNNENNGNNENGENIEIYSSVKMEKIDDKMYGTYVDQLLLGGESDIIHEREDEKEDENDFGGEEGFYFR